MLNKLGKIGKAIQSGGKKGVSRGAISDNEVRLLKKVGTPISISRKLPESSADRLNRLIRGN